MYISDDLFEYMFETYACALILAAFLDDEIVRITDIYGPGRCSFDVWELYNNARKLGLIDLEAA